MIEARPLIGRRILIVEDEYFLARDFSDWLADAGAEIVGPAPDVEQARTLLGGQRVDLALVDINLGRGPTFVMARLLTEAGVPFVFATGYDRTAIPPEFGSARRLQKPFRGEDLVAAARALV